MGFEFLEYKIKAVAAAATTIIAIIIPTVLFVIFLSKLMVIKILP
jgi:hypothetical protein